NEWDRAVAAKRGGGQDLLPLEDEAVEGRYLQDLRLDNTPEGAFDNRWAVTLLNQALLRLSEEYLASNRAWIFEQLKSYLVEKQEYSALAAQLEMSPGAVATAVYRLRRRYRELVEDEIAHTVSSPDDIEEELRHLLSVLSS